MRLEQSMDKEIKASFVAQGGKTRHNNYWRSYSVKSWRQTPLMAYNLLILRSNRRPWHLKKPWLPVY